MKKIGLALVAMASTAILVSCSPSVDSYPSGGEPSQGSSSAPSKSTPETPSHSSSTVENDRGEVQKKIGETAWVESESGEKLLSFTVDGFKFVTCSDYAGELNGKALAVDISVKTSKNFEGPLTVDGQPGFISFGAYYWKGYDDSGLRMNDLNSDAIQNCFESRSTLLPDYLGKAEKAEGVVLLDVTSNAGEVVFDPSGDGGWVWHYSNPR